LTRIEAEGDFVVVQSSLKKIYAIFFAKLLSLEFIWDFVAKEQYWSPSLYFLRDWHAVLHVLC